MHNYKIYCASATAMFESQSTVSDSDVQITEVEKSCDQLTAESCCQSVTELQSPADELEAKNSVPANGNGVSFSDHGTPSADAVISVSDDDHQTDELTEVVVEGANLLPAFLEPESKLDDDPLSELSQKFVDSLGLPIGNPTSANENAPEKNAEAEKTPEPAAASNDGPTVEEAREFNEAMTMISAFAEDVVKTWFARIYDRQLADVFPDGLTNNVATITMMPDDDMIRTRRRARLGRDEEVRDDNMHEDDSAGWELKLAVVEGDHRTNLDEWKIKGPVVLHHMQGLLKMAWGYINYALESYELPDKHLFLNKVVPSPWGTLYILGAPEGTPQIGVEISTVRPTPKSKSE